MNAQRHVNIGDIHVHVDGSGLASGEGGVSEVAQNIGDQVNEQVSRALVSASARSGNPT